MLTRRRRFAAYGAVLLVAVCSFALSRYLGLERVQVGHAGGETLEIVPVELVLLIDTSSSVDDTEYELQKRGYERAFRNDSLQDVIVGAGGIVVTYIEWSDADYQDIRLDWTKLTTAAECETFGDQIGALVRVNSDSTMMAPALQFGADRIASNTYSGMKRVIDVSGDGRCKNYDYYLVNTGYSAEHGKKWNDVISDISGVVGQVNGICITNDAGVVDFYRDVLPQGNDAFWMQVGSFEEFEAAILTKLEREIGKVPGFYD